MLLHEKLRSRRLLLASQSPRRRELMTACGLPYTLALKYDCEEHYPAALPAREVPVFLSRLKSEAYPAPLAAGEILLTADTVVVLRDLSGRRHTVVSGVTLRTAARMHTFAVETDVWFRPLTDEETVYYVDTFRPFDKAGAYGIQEWIGYAAIERIDGSFYNVMGLPVQRLYTELDKFIDLL